MEEPRGVSAISSGWEVIGVVGGCSCHGSPGTAHGVSNLTLLAFVSLRAVLRLWCLGVSLA